MRVKVGSARFGPRWPAALPLTRMTVPSVIAIRRLVISLVAIATILVCAASAQRASALEIGLQDDSVFLTQRFYYDTDKAYQQAAELGVTHFRTNVYWSDFVRYGY